MKGQRKREKKCEFVNIRENNAGAKQKTDKIFARIMFFPYFCSVFP